MNKRNSNMELLRITAMLMIIASHILNHCIYVQLTDTNLISQLSNEWICQPHFLKRLCMPAIIVPFGTAANAIFVLISGYFMASKPSVDLTKISKKLLLQHAFAAFVLGTVSVFVYRNITTLPLSLISYNSFGNSSWFVGYFFIIMVIAKVFLNRFLGRLSPQNYVMFMAAIFALVQFSWSRSVMNNMISGLDVICTGVFLYSLGGYIKKYNPFESVSLWVLFAIFAAITFFLLANFYISTANKIRAFDPNGGNLFIQDILGYGNYHIIPIALGITLFELFRRINLPDNSVINLIGSSTFMVYLIHDNDFFYSLWKTQNWLSLLYENVFLFAAVFILWTVGTFSVGFLCFCLFKIVCKLLPVIKPLATKRG